MQPKYMEKTRDESRELVDVCRLWRRMHLPDLRQGHPRMNTSDFWTKGSELWMCEDRFGPTFSNHSAPAKYPQTVTQNAVLFSLVQYTGDRANHPCDGSLCHRKNHRFLFNLNFLVFF